MLLHVSCLKARLIQAMIRLLDDAYIYSSAV
jgi:hypothetical protein